MRRETKHLAIIIGIMSIFPITIALQLYIIPYIVTGCDPLSLNSTASNSTEQLQQLCNEQKEQLEKEIKI